MSKALTIGKIQREHYLNFLMEQYLDAKSAKDAGLTTLIAERRKRFAKTFYTQQYFEFICFVESTFLSNLNLKMMMAYADGNLVHETKAQLLTNNITITKFNDLCNRDEALRGEEAEQIMKYIVDRYTNMRGTYIVKFLKVTGNRSDDRLVDAQATRTKVANVFA